MITLKAANGYSIRAVPSEPTDMFGNSRSGKWEGVRRSFLKDNPYCACCGRMSHLNVHHIKPFHAFPDLELVKANLITLCEYTSLNCHLYMGHLLDWKYANPRIVADAKRFMAMLKKIRQTH